VKGRPARVPGGSQFRTQLACETCRLGLGASNCDQAFARETVIYGRLARDHPGQGEGEPARSLATQCLQWSSTSPGGVALLRKGSQ